MNRGQGLHIDIHVYSSFTIDETVSKEVRLVGSTPQISKHLGVLIAVVDLEITNAIRIRVIGVYESWRKGSSRLHDKCWELACGFVPCLNQPLRDRLPLALMRLYIKMGRGILAAFRLTIPKL